MSMLCFIPSPTVFLGSVSRRRISTPICPVQTSYGRRKACLLRMQLFDVEPQQPQASRRDVTKVTEETEAKKQKVEEALSDEPLENEYFGGEDSEADDTWYSVAQPIAKADTGAVRKGRLGHAPASEDGVLDLGTLDDMGREVLAGASYHQVVDVDIDEGGVLEDDDDNNDLFCGVGLDALIESEQVMKNLREGLNIETATHVQLSAIPRVMDKRDIVIQSHTGTGKTLAFLLPLLDEIDEETPYVQGVIVAPTRELAMQISRECERLCEGTGIRSLALIGGANPVRQVEKLRKRQPHIVVGTPGRVAELEENHELRVKNVGMFVVDEVDQCIQAGMGEDVVYLLKAMMKRTQKILVSATSDVDSVRSFAGEYLHKPVLLRVGGAQRLPKQISHWFCVVPARMRVDLIRKLMHTNPAPTRAIAFVDDPRRVDIVVERLYHMRIIAGALRGNAHKLERAEVLTAFRKGKISLLVTTEVAARGLDIPEISHVFNLDLPTDGDHYVHRAGRCGRAGNVGTVVSVTTAETAFVIGRLEKELGVTITRMEPRDGEYSPTISRRSKGPRDEKRALTTAHGKRQKVGRDKLIRQETNALSSSNADVINTQNASKEGFSSSEASSEVVDEEAVMRLVRQIDAEEKSAKQVGRKKPAKAKSKKKSKAKARTDVVEKEDGEKNVKVKRRWRDLKNKGKPKGRLGKAKEDNTPRANGTESTSDAAVKINEIEPRSRSPKRERGDNPYTGKSRLSYKAMAARDGWVGNR